jgi:aminopeptidase-like protein
MVEEINSYLNKLFPLNRSISGKGNEQTLNILKEICPLDIKSINSNTQIFEKLGLKILKEISLLVLIIQTCMY